MINYRIQLSCADRLNHHVRVHIVLEKLVLIDIEDAGFWQVLKEGVLIFEHLELGLRAEFLVDHLHHIVVVLIPEILQEGAELDQLLHRMER